MVTQAQSIPPATWKRFKQEGNRGHIITVPQNVKAMETQGMGNTAENNPGIDADEEGTGDKTDSGGTERTRKTEGGGEIL